MCAERGYDRVNRASNLNRFTTGAFYSEGVFRAPLLAAAAAAAIMAAPAAAAPLDIIVRGPNGQPLTDAVVTVDSARTPAGPIRFPWPYVVAQHNIAFAPHVLIVPIGASVAFPNKDRVRHHVYSFSKPKKFELKLYGQEEARSVVFDKPGLVAIGCNIHDAMSGFVVVVATPYAAKTDASGHVHLDVPAGPAVLHIWHPAIHAPGNQMNGPIALTAAGLTRTVDVGS